MLKHFQSFSTFSDRVKSQNEERKIQEKTAQQKEYADFFFKLLQQYDVTSPDQLDDSKKKEFFDKVDKGWDKGTGITDAGKTMVGESAVTEKEITSDEEFKEYAKKLLKEKHKGDYDEKKAEETITGILKDKGDKSYGDLVGMLQNS